MDTSLWAAMFPSDLPPSFHHEKKPQRARQREAKRFKGWQQHHGLEVLSLLLTVQEREEVEGVSTGRGPVGEIAMKPTSFFSPLSSP